MAVTKRIYATKDAYFHSHGLPGNGLGELIELSRNSNGQHRDVGMYFPLPNDLIANEIIKAEIVLWGVAYGGQGYGVDNIEVVPSRITTDWIEGFSVTEIPRTSATGELKTKLFSTSSRNVENKIDVTQTIKSSVENPTSYYGVYLETVDYVANKDTQMGISFASRENSTVDVKNKPYLLITLDPKPKSGKVKDQEPGTEFDFVGEQWILLDPSKGYCVKKEHIGEMPFDSSGYASFDTTVTTNIASYLQKVYFQGFPEDDKAFVKKGTFASGGLTYLQAGSGANKPQYSIAQMEAEENSYQVFAYAGLMSVSDIRKYSSHYGNGSFFSAAGAMWLRNVVPGGQYTWSTQRGLLSENYYPGNNAKIYPTIFIDTEATIGVGGLTKNTVPDIVLTTLNNSTLYENDIVTINGTATDTDSGEIVNVRYQINSGTPTAIATGISDGTTPIPFSRQLTFKGGKLYLGETAITGNLAEGIAHTLKVWAEDDKGGKSVVEERTFYVVPNRPPKLTVNPITLQSDLIDADKLTVTGTTSDPDGNDTVVSYKLNNGLATEIYRGPDAAWSFDLLTKLLKNGDNTLVVETVDSYNFKTSVTKTIHKTANLTPLAKSVYRGTIEPPAGTAQGVFLWIERDEEQPVTAEISMTNGTEQEQFAAMTFDSSGPTDVGKAEDFFKFRAALPCEKIAIKLSWTGDKPIFKVSGALQQ